MAQLTLRNARTSIQRGIVRALADAYHVRQPAVATLTLLRALPSQGIPHDTYRVLTSNGFAYRWSRYSKATDDGNATVKPNDLITTNPGRWLKTSSVVSSGYLKQIEAYNGDAEIGAVAERLLGQSPSILVVWTGGKHELQSWNVGALWYYRCSFDIWVFSACLRDQLETEEGSFVTAEATVDPGINQVMGDVKTALAGADYGLEGVAQTRLGDEMRIVEDQASRTALEKLSVVVLATLYNPDTDLVALANPMKIQEQLADTPANVRAGIGPDNYITAGCTMPTGTGLTKTPDAGSVYVGSALVTVIQDPVTFSANKNIYRDIDSSGNYHYTEVGYYETPSDPVTGRLRIGVSVTDGSSVIFDRLLADSLINYGDAFDVPKQ